MKTKKGLDFIFSAMDKAFSPEAAYVQINEPTLTYHFHPKFIVHLSLMLDVIESMGFEK